MPEQLKTRNHWINIPPIPYELLRPVLEHLASDKPSLCAVSLVSTTFRQEAQRILFREVNRLSKAKLQLLFLRVVAASPTRLALFVHEYALWGPHSGHNAIVEPGLKAMRNLKRLNMGLSFIFADYMEILCGCTISLERFDGSALDGHAHEIFERFLPGQPALRHLGMECSKETISKITDPQCSFVTSCCLQLSSVTGSWKLVQALLPRRKIMTIRIVDNIGVDEESLGPLAQKVKEVKALALPASRISNLSQPDHSVLRYFSALTVLEITFLDFHEGMCGLYEWSAFFDTLLKIPALRTLTLSGAHEAKLDIEEGNVAFTRRLFDTFGKNLTSILLETSTGTYTRYMQGATEMIGAREVRKEWLAETI